MKINQRTVGLTDYEKDAVEHFAESWREGFSVSLRRIIREFKEIKDAEENSQPKSNDDSRQLTLNLWND
jgi:hypothetical protein